MTTFSFTTPPPQTLQSLSPKDYEIRLIVAGTRHYNKRREFHEMICRYLARFDKPVLFISGAAASGADRLIIQWCHKFGFPCLEMPADWEAAPRAAGYIRNAAMAEVGNHLFAFYDGESKGTAHMIDLAMQKLMRVKIFNYNEPEDVPDGDKR